MWDSAEREVVMYKLIAALDDTVFSAKELYNYVLDTICKENLTPNFWLNLAHVYLNNRYGEVHRFRLLKIAEEYENDFIAIVTKYEKEIEQIDEKFLLTRFVKEFNPDIWTIQGYIHEVSKFLKEDLFSELFQEKLFQKLYCKKCNIANNVYFEICSMLENLSLQATEENLDIVVSKMRALKLLN